jgi:hypothetical protein
MRKAGERGAQWGVIDNQGWDIGGGAGDGYPPDPVPGTRLFTCYGLLVTAEMVRPLV